MMSYLTGSHISTAKDLLRSWTSVASRLSMYPSTTGANSLRKLRWNSPNFRVAGCELVKGRQRNKHINVIIDSNLGDSGRN